MLQRTILQTPKVACQIVMCWGTEMYQYSSACLQTIIYSLQGYMKPLKQPENSFMCDPSLVDEIFDQIPELMEHHEQFLEQVNHVVQNWPDIQTVGDILVQSVSNRSEVWCSSLL